MEMKTNALLIHRFNQPFLIQSNNASLSLRFRMDPATGADQVIEGAFAYYNGTFLFPSCLMLEKQNINRVLLTTLSHTNIELEGFRRPGTLCDASFDPQTSPSQGQVTNSFDSTIFWSIVGPFNCTSTFTPGERRSVTLTVMLLMKGCRDIHRVQLSLVAR